MKLVLSRKGFDSSSGGCPSPVFPDGSFVSLPIPDKQSPIRYSDLQYEGINVGELVADLTGSVKRKDHMAHLDPDLIPELMPRQPGWRPSLGQIGGAQAHLRNQGVTEGDLFLFFGLFRSVEKIDGKWRFQKESRPFQAIWGWLQIGDIWPVKQELADECPWVRDHPHLAKEHNASNMLYVGRSALDLGQGGQDHSGAGVFPRINKATRLTAEESHKPSTWRLPAFFYPDNGKPPLSYHSNRTRWQRDAEQCLLQSVPRGQEFVLDAGYYPEAVPWARGLIGHNS